MENSQNDTEPEAILFFEDSQIIREIRFEEFEAILNHVVGIPAFAGNIYEAAFVRVNAQLDVVAAVLFTISFDKNGNADQNWKIPLQHMATVAGRGPDLGAGPINLACRSQCPVPWHQRHMWDPAMGAKDNSFARIRERIKANGLGFACAVREQKTANDPRSNKVLQAQRAVDTPTAVVTPNGQTAFNQHERNQAARLIKHLRLRISTLENARKDDVIKLKRAFKEKMDIADAKVKRMRQSIDLAEARHAKLKERFAEHSAEYDLERIQFLDQIKEARVIEQSKLTSVEEQSRPDTKTSADEELLTLKENLDMREVELLYRDSQITALSVEVEDLKKEKQRLLNEGAGKFFERLSNSGMTFVAYHPGVGHLTVPVADTGRYLDSPNGYVAEKCFVTEQHYSDWLEHYEHPACAFESEDGAGCCAKPIPRIDNPAEFTLGQGDRCSLHIDRGQVEQDKMLKIS